MSNTQGVTQYIQITGNVVSAPNYGTITQVYNDDDSWLRSLPQTLKISEKADYAYYPGKQEEGMRRGSCTPGTRKNVIKAITDWANDTSPTCPPMFWLSGQGGAGKTTIIFTITKHFDVPNSQPTTLGGSFFCSYHSLDTRNVSAIVRTIVCQLAMLSSSFRAALKTHADVIPRMVSRGPQSQFAALLAQPWHECSTQRLERGEPCYIISIDAIDELDPPGGTEFLKTLVKALKTHNLSGLKFFVTSRLEQGLVNQIEAFGTKEVYRLEQMPLGETNADIKLYLQESLDSSIANDDALVDQIVAEAGGLFIYAATIVDYLEGRSASQQRERVTRLLNTSKSAQIQGATAKLDNLYLHILETCLVDPRDQKDPIIQTQCLAILHTLLCTSERTSTPVAVGLLNRATANRAPLIEPSEAEALVQRLHAALYIQSGRVLWYHKSFLDFIFDKQRSGPFHCQQGSHHHLLATGCFGIMREDLRFNIANIQTSYDLDRHSPGLSDVN